MDQNFFWLSVALCALGMISLVTTVAIGWRGVKSPTAPSSKAVASKLPFAGPIARLSFSESLDPSKFAEAAEEEALAYAKQNLQSFVADATTLTLQSIRTWAAQSEMTVTASSAATSAMRAGKAAVQRHDASGRLLPHVVDGKSGQMLEVMKEAGRGRQAITAAATASTIVVSAAHIIATADLARKLHLANQKLDLLLKLRQVDQEATLERIYTASRELLALPLDEVRHLEIWRLRGELRELRAAWRREFEHHLIQIEDPAREAWIDRIFTTQNYYDRRISGKISAGVLQLMMVEYSLRLDRVLAEASGAWDLSTPALTDELAAIERVGTLLKEKAAFISKTRRDSAGPLIEGIATMVAHYRTLISSSAGTLALAPPTSNGPLETANVSLQPEVVAL